MSHDLYLRTQVNFRRLNKIEAMWEGHGEALKLNLAQLLRLRAALQTSPPFYLSA